MVIKVDPITGELIEVRSGIDLTIPGIAEKLSSTISTATQPITTAITAQPIATGIGISGLIIIGIIAFFLLRK